MYAHPQHSERFEDGFDDLATEAPRSGRNLPPGLREAPEVDQDEVEDAVSDFSE